MDSQELFELAMKHIYGDGVPEDNDLAIMTSASSSGIVCWCWWRLSQPSQ